jgi:hypothetical protein
VIERWFMTVARLRRAVVWVVTLPDQVARLTAAVIVLQTPDLSQPWFDDRPGRATGTADMVLREINTYGVARQAAARRAQARGELHGRRDRGPLRPLGPEEPDADYLAGYCAELAEVDA